MRDCDGKTQGFHEASIPNIGRSPVKLPLSYFKPVTKHAGTLVSFAQLIMQHGC